MTASLRRPLLQLAASAGFFGASLFAFERRLRRHVGAIRRAAVELGSDPDFAVRPLNESVAGRAAHRVGWAIGTVGEWADRQAAHRRRPG